MVTTSPNSPYHTLIAPFLAKKRALQLDCWGSSASESVNAALDPLIEWIEENAPRAKDQYPTPWGVERQLLRGVVQTYVASSFADDFAEFLRGLGEEELALLARSWRIENCVKREGLNKVLSDCSEGRRKAENE